MTEHKLDINDKTSTADSAGAGSPDTGPHPEYIVVAKDGIAKDKVHYSPGAIIELEDSEATKLKETGDVRDKGDKDA